MNFEAYETSYAQKRFFMIREMAAESNTAYNLPRVMVVEGEFDKEKFEKAFYKLIQRHESLRTEFEFHRGEIIQKVYDDIDFKIEYEQAQGRDWDQIIHQFVQPFDLEAAPLLRVKLIKVGEKTHLFMFDIDHIITDGASMGILTKELISLYAGKELPPVDIQYVDFVMWQNDLLMGDQISDQEEYWLKEFESDQPLLNLPTDFPRPPVKDYTGSTYWLDFDLELTEKVKGFTSQTGTTNFMFLMAVYNILLARYSRQSDITIGTPVAGRQDAALMNTIGPFVNTLAIRNYPEGNKTFEEFLSQVKEKALESYQNQDYQFDMLVNKLDLDQIPNRTPLFDVMFVLQNTDDYQITVEGLQFSQYRFEEKASKMDLIIEAHDKYDNYRFKFIYATSLFKRETIERMAVHFENIIRQVIEEPEKKIAEIQLMGDEEREQILYDFNDTKAPYPSDKTLPQIFEEKVYKQADQTAIISAEGEKLTYAELNQRANKLARELRARGIKREMIVGIMVKRSPEMIIGILAILKAGGVYLPIDPDYPRERLDYILEDSQLDILLTNQKYIEKSGFKGETVIFEDPKIKARKNTNLNLCNTPEDLAYILYTSGSTGKPKGVMIEHRGVINTITDLQKRHPLVETDIILQSTVFTFDASMKEILWWFFAGASCCLLEVDGEKFPEWIVKTIEEYQVTKVKFVPTLLNEFLKAVENLGAEKVETLKYIFCGGDALSQQVVDRFNQLFTDKELYVVYGPTEATIHCTEDTITGPIEQSTALLGKPISNYQIYVLDEHLQPVPIGVPGEIYIGGVGVARGYYNNPTLTEERFITNPLCEEGRLYKSGDLGRWLEDGSLEFLGRTDYQVKIRGFRIELGEIENQLLAHPSIEETVVIDKKDAIGSKHLCGYIVSNEELTVPQLREYLADKLPEYMIPSFFNTLDHLPKNHSGKIDRQALLNLEEEIDLGIELVAATDELEERLISFWTEVLEVEEIGIEHNFFELGGHSIKAASFVARVFKEMKVELTLKEVFQNPTIKNLANIIRQKEKSLSSGIKQVKKRGYYPLSSAQKRLYLLDQKEETGLTYNMPGVVELQGELDQERFVSTFKEILKRHSLLRTSFDLIDGQPVQKIHSSVSLEMEMIQAEEKKLEEVIDQFIQSFDLSKPPLLRIALVKKDDGYYMILDMHHIISDGLSMGILLNDFIEIYGGRELEPLELEYKDYSVWQQDKFKEGRLKDAEEYWLNKLSGFRYTQFPKIPVIEGDEIGRGEVEIRFGHNLQTRIEEYCQQKNITRFIFLLAIFKIILYKETGQQDLTIGIPVAGRKMPGLKGIIGNFINVLLIRTQIEDKVSFTKYLEQVREGVMEAQEHEDYPFEELYLRLKERDDIQDQSLFSILFNNLPNQIRTRSVGDMKLVPYKREKTKAKYDLNFYIGEFEGEMGINLVYKDNLYNHFIIERLLSDIKDVSDLILSNPQLTIGEISLTEEDNSKDDFIEDFDDEFESEEFLF